MKLDEEQLKALWPRGFGLGLAGAVSEEPRGLVAPTTCGLDWLSVALDKPWDYGL